ncbi:hypothetical protein MPTK1_5g12150 [Marchantia polymorpha subsp. ruderalis]|uniref:Protein kinase domain-containing protein n=2 Tax=Marchantia polymorpha TaxID=3197 RepID=A0A176VLQ7_MARPO|nr:hypothetical protein AXG93_2916s1000 [Marchantia polymorpha subsp. ruderalis]PTQ26907.1 hypothetical protein MARPO_0274s0006 [Marchantia polymorpha]BBN11469.1 hypothetical protein Mp_5g12150 [Marchantia polymorpha subsp. ruderalis]|eukprot:PTQ26907.1 hypothetical protein MARPO_0274s0006 [Marchantia polymorpha]
MASARRRAPCVLSAWSIISLIVVHAESSDSPAGRLSADEDVLLQFRKELYITASNRKQLDENYDITLRPCESWRGIQCRNSSVIAIYNTQKMVLSGSVPAVLGSLPNLTRLSIPGMGFSGSITDALFNSSNLEVIDLSSNNLTGPIPASIGKLRKLNVLYLVNNQLNGTLKPLSGLAAAENFASLYLENNQLEGDLSPLENLTSLVVVKLSFNRLTGDVSYLQNLTKLQSLQVQGNQLSGNLSALANLQTVQAPSQPTQLLKLDLASNQLTGDVPNFFFSEQSRLYELLLGNNDLTGSLDPEGSSTDSSALEILELHNNHLSGSLGAGVLNFTRLKSLKVSNNSLTGECFSGFKKSTIMTDMDLSHNILTGRIPETLFRMPAVKADLSYNNFSGPLPENADDYVDQDNINLAGNPLLCTTTAEDFNLKLCGGVYSPQPIRAPPTTRAPSPVLLIGLAGGISSFCLLMVCVCLGVCLRYRGKRRSSSVQDNQHPSFQLVMAVQGGGNSIRHRTMKELREATNNFSAANMIGSGRFGSVYRGILDGEVVAIKNSERVHTLEAQKQVLNEITVLSQVRHRHLVALQGCCLTTNAAMLVMEYVPLGSLASNLQAPKRENLTWPVRFKICLQVAEALNYLHNAAQLPIYHHDVKCANILLDNNFDAKVADFGLSKLVPEHENHLHMHPDVQGAQHRTAKSDVYGFGVVLLELLMGRPVEELDFRGNGLSQLSAIVKDEESFMAHLDPLLLEEAVYQDDLRAGALALADVAIQCLQTSPADRPSMRKIVAFLSNLHGFSSSRKTTPSSSRSGVPNTGDPALALTAEYLKALDRTRNGSQSAHDSLAWGPKILTSEHLRALDRQKTRPRPSYTPSTLSSPGTAALSGSHSRSRGLDSDQSSRESLAISPVHANSSSRSSPRSESIWMPHSAALSSAKAATAPSSGHGVVSRSSSRKAASLSQALESDFRAVVPSPVSTMDSQELSLKSHSAPDSSSPEHTGAHFSPERRSAGSAASVPSVGRQPYGWRWHTSSPAHSIALWGAHHPGLEFDDQTEGSEDLSVKSFTSVVAGTEVIKGPQSGHKSDTRLPVETARVSGSSIQTINSENRAEVPSDASGVEEYSRASSEPMSQTRHPSKPSSDCHSRTSTRSSPTHEIEEVVADDYHAKGMTKPKRLTFTTSRSRSKKSSILYETRY